MKTTACATAGAILLAAYTPLCYAGVTSPSSPTSPPSSTAPIAQVLNGTIQGVYSSQYNQDFFLGVPFAQPPVNDLRFRNPASLNSTFNQTIQATQYAPYCVGYGPDSDNKTMSEDCLYLNVIRPAGYEGQSLPVAVWIYGSSFTMGGTSDPRFNLSYIVDNSVEIGKPIIAVSIPYRLSAFGWLASTQMSAEGQTNLALRDQRLALQWIQENIAAFGGDPSKVTIWGESSGAASVGFHLLAYNGRNDGLFHGAIMESGNPINTFTFKTPAEYDAMYAGVVLAAGCGLAFDTLACLRKTPFAILNAAISATNVLYTNPYLSAWLPIVDGDIIARYGSEQIADGSFIKVPIISGANTDEGTVFSPLLIYSQSDIASKVGDSSEPIYLPEDLVDDALAAYPDEPEYYIPSNEELGNTSIPFYLGNNQWRRSAAYWGDVAGIAPRRATCQAYTAAGVPTYSYRFNTRVSGVSPAIGSTHFDEVAFVMNNTQGLGYPSPQPFLNEPVGYYQLAVLMSRSWASFMHDLDPNSFAGRFSAAPAWPEYGSSSPVGTNMVWFANISSLAYTEADDFRQTGIQWINDHALAYKR